MSTAMISPGRRLVSRFGGAPAELVSPLSLEECCRRLRDGMDKPATFFGNRPVIGSISGTRLRAFKRIGYRNSFQTCLTAEMVERAGQTRIRCRFSIDPVVTVLLAAVLAVLVPVAVPMFLLLLAEPSAVLAIPMGMVVLVIAIACLGRGLAGGERELLLAFVADTVEAVVTTPPAAM